MAYQLVPQTADISIHALHEESDLTPSYFCVHSTAFQSTLSMRRATSFDAAAHNGM